MTFKWNKCHNAIGILEDRIVEGKISRLVRRRREITGKSKVSEGFKSVS